MFQSSVLHRELFVPVLASEPEVAVRSSPFVGLGVQRVTGSLRVSDGEDLSYVARLCSGQAWPKAKAWPTPLLLPISSEHLRYCC